MYLLIFLFVGGALIWNSLAGPAMPAAKPDEYLREMRSDLTERFARHVQNEKKR